MSLATEAFEADHDGTLILHAVSAWGRRYTQRCPQPVYEAVAREIEEAGPGGVDGDALCAALGFKHTPVAVALRFLVSRGVAERFGRRRTRATEDAAHLDAMIELEALKGVPDEAL